MSEPTPEATQQPTPPAPEAPATTAPQTPATPEQDVNALPEWARESLSKANKEAAGYRTRVRELEPLAKKATEIEEAQKTEQQKLADQLAEAQATATKAQAEAIRFRVAAKHRISEDHFELLGSGTEEEIEARAAKIAALQAAPKAPGTERPVEQLRPGATPGEQLSEDEVLYNQIYGKQVS